MMTTKTRVPVTEGLFAETAEGARLLGSRCVGCGTPYFPRSPVCHNPQCREPRIEDATFGPHGRLWSYAVQHYAPPAPVKYDQPFVPYAIGLVDLPEGLRVLARLRVDDLRTLRIGMDVELAIDHLCTAEDGSEVVTWKFSPR